MSVAPWPLQVLHTVGFPGVDVVVSAAIGASAGAAALLRGALGAATGVSSAFLRGAIYFSLVAFLNSSKD
jgi:hypothetical protein